MPMKANARRRETTTVGRAGEEVMEDDKRADFFVCKVPEVAVHYPHSTSGIACKTCHQANQKLPPKADKCEKRR